MSTPIYSRRPVEDLGSDPLAELALDLRWSFNHAADALWQRLDPELWSLTHNPWVVLQTVSHERLAAVSADPAFQKVLNELAMERRQAVGAPGWFQEAHPDESLTTIAYFSMEFMLSEALPIYSGGLGNVAGDQLKAASNLGLPVTGVGLLYQQGYFRQEIDARGQQMARYPFNDPGQLPIRPLRHANGEWVRLSIAFSGSVLWIRAWQVQVGRVQLYLLDTNDPANAPAYRGITGELYGGDDELRLQQEIVLGIGGWRLLRAAGLDPEVCHLNEGHAAFAVLERARSRMVDHHEPFELALAITRAGNIFTTHTPVEAGFDHFAPGLMAKFLAPYAANDLAVPFEDLLALGRRDPYDATEPFTTTYLGIRGSGAVNGVSRLHGSVCRRIFQPLFPRWPQVEVPITHVTNGVHISTWDSIEADSLWEETCGKARWHGPTEDLDRRVRRISDRDLWHLREGGRSALISDVRMRVARQLAGQGASAVDAAAGGALIFSPDTLTIGFARRFATYKRPNLLLQDPDRLVRILTDQHRPMQLVVAGKAHPGDLAGQALIVQWIAFAGRPDVRGSVVFLSDYDMLMAERLVQGVDLWINTPRRPWEACGTSGMKVLVNGGLNLSELDGWWAEAYSPKVGWALGDGQDRGDDPAWDVTEGNALYALLEGEVATEFYTRNDDGIPAAWVARIRESMASLTPTFSANRAVREYTESHYLPALTNYRARTADRGRRAANLLAWRRMLEREWGTMTFRAVDVRTDEREHLFRVHIDFGNLAPEHVRIELYADAQGTDSAVREIMTRVEDEAHDVVYVGRVTAARPATDFTPRVVPFHESALVPLEAPNILWYDPVRKA